MKITPIMPAYRSHDRDERHDAEMRRIMLLIRLLKGMDVPAFRLIGLSPVINSQRLVTLKWLSENLSAKNKDHANFAQAKNLIDMLISAELRKVNECV